MGIGLEPPTECTFSSENSIKNKCGIYFIYCSSNNKIYIGQSINILVRLKAHSNDLMKGKHRNTPLQNTYNKYGKQNMYCGVMYITEELDKYETNLISTYNKLNLALNCDSGGNKNKVVSLETRQKQSIIAKKRPPPRLGVKCSIELRKKLSEAHKGIPNSRKGTKTGKPAWNRGLASIYPNHNKKAVHVFDIKLRKYVGIFGSIKEFCTSIGWDSKNYKRLDVFRIMLGGYILTSVDYRYWRKLK